MHLGQIVVDSLNPPALARFWAGLLGGEPVDRARAWSHVDAPGFPRISFQPVAEPRVGKNRLHLDVEVGYGEIPDAVVHALALGASVVGELVSDTQGSYQVMSDPEGNEFCFVSV